MALLELDGVTVEVAGRTILKEVSLRLDEGEKIILKGPSGSGKSSLLRAALGLVPLAAGKVLFEGREIDSENVTWFRRQVAYVAQEPVLGGSSGREALLLPFSFRSRRGQSPGALEVEQVLESLGLPKAVLGQPVNSLSGGEKQRIALGRAMLLEARLFLLDEITSALDQESQNRIVEAIDRPDLTVLAVSHGGLLEERFERVCQLREGRVERSNGDARN